MKPFLLSLLLLAGTLLSSAAFIHFADQDVHAMVTSLDEQIIPAVLSENWNTAESEFRTMHAMWRKHKNAYIFFSNAGAVQDTELSFHRLSGYFASKDKASCSGELSFLRRRLLFLHEYETISIENVI